EQRVQSRVLGKRARLGGGERKRGQAPRRLGASPLFRRASRRLRKGSSDMRVLMTGSEGNIGVHLARQLRDEGHTVMRADCLPGWHDDYVQANIVFPNDLLPTFASFRPQVVYHLAAMVSRVTCESSPHMAVDTNLSGTNNIAQ